jgi:hypothetical protein
MGVASGCAGLKIAKFGDQERKSRLSGVRGFESHPPHLYMGGLNKSLVHTMTDRYAAGSAHGRSNDKVR